jgi:hypothetical protein
MSRHWPVERIDGIDVRVAEHAGPAVVGLFKPEIVFPRWLRDVTPSERAMARVRLGEVRKQFDSGPWSRVYLESSVRSSETGGDPGLNRRISITMPFLGRMIRNEKPILSFEREVYAGSHA